MGALAAALPYIAIGSSIAGGITGAIGAEKSASAQSTALMYQSQVAANNAQIAQQQANLTTASGAQQAATEGLKTRAQVGQIKAAQGASNIDVGTGSAVDVRSSAAELGELNALTIRSNAARQAYGYETNAASYKAESALDVYGAGQAKEAGNVGAITSILGGASSAGSQYGMWKLASGSGQPDAYGNLF